RKRLLFSCACCRRLWAMIPFELGAQWVELVEACADGESQPDRTREFLHESMLSSSVVQRLAKRVYDYDRDKHTDLGVALTAKQPLMAGLARLGGTEHSVGGEMGAALATLRYAGQHAWKAARRKPTEHRQALSHAAVDAEQDVLVQFIRDIFGNPF